MPYRDPMPKPLMLPLFSGSNSICTKCGAAHAYTKFRQEDNVLRRECRECKFIWLERPLDQ